MCIPVFSVIAFQVFDLISVIKLFFKNLKEKTKLIKNNKYFPANVCFNTDR